MNDSVYSLPKGRVFSGYEAISMYTNVYDGPDSFLKDPVDILVTTNVVLPDYIGTDDLRLLLIGQTDKVENGIYVIDNNILSRSSDMTDGIHAAGSLICAQDVNGYYTCTCDYNVDVVGTNDLFFSFIYLTPYNILGTGATDPVGDFSYVQFYKSDPSNHVNSSQYFNDDNDQVIQNYRSIIGYKLILGKPSSTTYIQSDEDFVIEGISKVELLSGLSGNGSGSGDISITATNDLAIDTNACEVTSAGNLSSASLSTSVKTSDFSENRVNRIGINGTNFFKGMIVPKTDTTTPIIQTITFNSFQGKITISDASSLGPMTSATMRINNSGVSVGGQVIFVSASQSDSSFSSGIPVVEVYNVQSGYYELMIMNMSSSFSLSTVDVIIQVLIIKGI